MVDIAQLGIAVNSRPVEQAEASLDGLSRSAKGAQVAASALEGQTAKLNTQTATLNTTARAAAAAEAQQAKAMQAATVQAAANDKAMRNLNFRRQQFMFQSNDIISGLIMGQPPMMVAMQQGGQLAQIYGGKGGLSDAASDASAMIKGLVSRLTPMSIAITAAIAAVGGLTYMFIRNTEEVKDYDEAVSDLSSSLRDARAAQDMLRAPLEEIQESYGGSEDAARDYVRALNDVREAEAKAALEASLRSMAQKEEFASVSRLTREATNDNISLGRGMAFVEMQSASARGELSELGLTTAQASEYMRLFTNLQTAQSFEDAAEGAAELRRFVEGIGGEFAENLLPSLVEFEGLAASAFGKSADEANRFKRETELAADAVDRLTNSAERAAQNRLAAQGDDVALIRRRADVEMAELDAIAAKAIENGANAQEVNATVAQAKADITAATEIEITEIHAREAKKRRDEANRRQKEIDDSREKALDAIASKESAFIDDRLKAEGREIELIQRRLQIEHAALDELANEAIRNGADEAQVWEQVARAKRNAMFAANQEIYDHNKGLLDKEMQDNARRIEEGRRLKERIARFDRSMMAQGAYGTPDISSSPFASDAASMGPQVAFDIGSVLQQEQDRLAALAELEAEKLATLKGNHELMLEAQQEFEDRRVAIMMDSEERQRLIMEAAQQDLSARIQTDFDILVNAAGSMLGETSAAYRALLVAQKAAAFAQAAIAAPAAAARAMAEVPFPANYLAAAAVYANVIAMGMQIRQVAIGGGRLFGGAVSGGIPYEITEDGRPEIFQQGNRQYLLPGRGGTVISEPRMPRASNDNGGGGMNVTVINNAGVSVKTEQIGPNDVRMMIEEMTPAIVQEEAPKAVSSQLSRRNSKFSKSLTRSTTTQMRRP